MVSSSIYYFDKEAEEYKEYVKAIDEYISLIGKAEAMHLALDFEGLSDALSQIVKANNFVNEYFSIQQSIGLIESQIKAKEEEISIVENDEKLNREAFTDEKNNFCFSLCAFDFVFFGGWRFSG